MMKSKLLPRIELKREVLPTAHCVTLFESEDRRENLRRQKPPFDIQYHEFKRYSDCEYQIEGTRVLELHENSFGPLTSHLLTIKKWYETSNDDYGFIIEDDITLESMSSWGFRWNEFISRLPKDWDIVQLCSIREHFPSIQFERRRKDKIWGAQAYILSRKHAKYLIDRYIVSENKFEFDTQNLPIVESILFDVSRESYVCPLFFEDCENTRMTYCGNELIQINGQGEFHHESFNTLRNWWRENKPVSLNSLFITEHNQSVFKENYFTFPNLYSQVVNVFPSGSRFVEVGVFKGQSASYMATEIRNSYKDIEFYCVDTFKGSDEHDVTNLRQEFEDNMSHVKGYYETMEMDSVSAAKQFEDNSLDFVFIDASHDYENVRADIEAWYSKVKYGGILAGHDYSDYWQGVKQAVNERFQNDFSVSESCWIHSKKHNKLDGLPTVNYISLKEATDRREHLNRQFAKWGITKIRPFIKERISELNVDFTGQFIHDIDIHNKGANQGHLSAITSWYEESNEEIGFFVEDDVSFETVEHWDFTWKEFVSTLPKDWECIQMSIIRSDEITFTLHERDPFDWSATAYIIKRSYAKKLINNYVRDYGYHLEIPNSRLMPIVENILFEGIGKVYTIPLFVENATDLTTCNQNEVNVQSKYHEESSQIVLDWWKNPTFSLCKTALRNGGSVHPLMIHSDFANGKSVFNPSIFNDDGVLRGVLRKGSWTLFQNESQTIKNQILRETTPTYLYNESQIKTTTNYYFELNNDLTMVRHNLVDTSLLDTKPQWHFSGLEDARFVKWDNRYFLIGCRRDTEETGIGRIEFSELDSTMRKEIARYRIQPPIDPNSYCEKNWMPILDKPFHFVKWTNPTEVVKVDLETCTSQRVSISSPIELPLDLKGGTHVLSWENGYIALVHESDSNDGLRLTYRHRFVIWNDKFEIQKVSNPFTLMNGVVEFACGMCEFEGDFLITFGYYDNASFLCRISKNSINKLI